MRPRNLELPRRLSGNSAPAGAIPAARVMVSSAKDLRRSALGMAISRGLGGLSRSPGERQKERQVTLQLLGNEEILLYVLMPMLAEFCRDFRMRRSEEHTSELQSHSDLVCRLLLEKKNKDKLQSRRRLLQTELTVAY